MRNLVSTYNRVSVKDELIDRILLTGTSIGFGVLIISLFPLDKQPLNLDLLLDCTAISFLFLTYFYRQKLTIYFKTNTILILVFAVVVSDLLEDGLYTPDSSLMVILPFLSILVYNFRVTFWIFLFCVATYFGIGVAIETGILESENYVVGTNSLFRWAEQIIALSVVIFVITLFLQKYMSVNNELIHSLENQNQELINRDTLLTAITQNIPRSYLSVFDENLVVQFTGGSEFDHHRINPDSFNGLRLEEIFKDVETKIYQSIKEAYEATLQGESQILEVQIEGNYYLHKTMPLTQHDGRINSMLSVVENITEQVKTKELIERNLEEKNVLLQEIHHRVKNNLAIVSGLLTLQNARVKNEELKHIINKSVNRILSIAKVHELLYESNDFTQIPFEEYVKELSNTVLESMNSDEKNISFSCNIEIDSISINHGIPLGIVFNELITNSIKYGFNGKENGLITIRAFSKNGINHIEYLDNGVGIASFDTTYAKGLGFTLINSLLSQIDATSVYATDNGFKLSFTFPARLNQA